MAGLREYLMEIPPVTRFFLLFSVTLLLALSLGLFPDLSPFLYSLDVIRYAQTGMWMFAQFFIPNSLAKSGIGVVLDLYKFHVPSFHLENRTGHFRGNFPDYLWCVLVCGVILLALQPVFASLGILTGLMHSQLLLCLAFLWLRKLMNLKTTIFYFITTKTYYLPLFDFGLALLNGGADPGNTLAGFLTGYLYECIQSDTIPFYNLVPNAYASRLGLAGSAQRVGFSVDPQQTSGFIQPAVFDLGYWKAPLFLYGLLKYPQNTSERRTAFSKSTSVPNPPPSAKTSGYRATTSAFQGKGHRLGT